MGRTGDYIRCGICGGLVALSQGYHLGHNVHPKTCHAYPAAGRPELLGQEDEFERDSKGFVKVQVRRDLGALSTGLVPFVPVVDSSDVAVRNRVLAHTIRHPAYYASGITTMPLAT